MTLVCISTDLMFSSQVRAVATKVGLDVKVASGHDALLQAAAGPSPAIVCLDLDTLGVEVADLVRELQSAATPPKAVIAVAAHVHEGRLEAARLAGCDETLSRGAFHRRGQAILEQLLQK